MDTARGTVPRLLFQIAAFAAFGRRSRYRRCDIDRSTGPARCPVTAGVLTVRTIVTAVIPARDVGIRSGIRCERGPVINVGIARIIDEVANRLGATKTAWSTATTVSFGGDGSGDAERSGNADSRQQVFETHAHYLN